MGACAPSEGYLSFCPEGNACVESDVFSSGAE
jgi:hypothetical protein